MKTKLILLLTLLFSITTFAQNDLENGLVANYTFSKIDFADQKMPDFSGNENNIDCYEISFFDDDPSGQENEATAVSYPTDDVYMDLNIERNSPSINAMENMTISFWTIRSSTVSQKDYNPMLTIADEDAAYNLEIENDNHHLRFSNVANGTIQGEVTTSGTFHGHDWHHVAITVDRDNNKLTIFYDGINQGEISLEIIAPVNPVISFGKYFEGDITNYTVCFDHMFIHNRVLSSEEIIAAMGEFVTGVDQLLRPAEVNIFPNPATNIQKIHVEFTDMTLETSVDILDAQGRLVRQEMLDNQQLNVSGIAKGIYFLKVKNEDGFFIEKIILK